LPPAGLLPSRETRELDIAIAMAFKFWDLVVANKKPFALTPELPPAPPAVSEAAADTLSVGPLFANSRSTDVDS